jgi:hypothetical protein
LDHTRWQDEREREREREKERTRYRERRREREREREIAERERDRERWQDEDREVEIKTNPLTAFFKAVNNFPIDPLLIDHHKICVYFLVRSRFHKNIVMPVCIALSKIATS